MSEIIPVIFHTSRIGTFHPMLGVAETINPERHLVIRDAKTFRETLRLFRRAARSECTPAVPVVINYGGTGTRWVAANLFKLAIPHAFLINIGWSKRPLHLFDLVVLPPDARRSGIPERKILDVQTLPTHITPHKLAAALEKWRPVLQSDNRKTVAVVIGGHSPSWLFTMDHAADCVKHVKRFAKRADCRLLLTTSRRTPPDVAAYIKEQLKPTCHHSYFGESDGENPYMGYLACADAFIVTGDSKSMLSEAVDTRKPVYTYQPHDLNGEEATFLNHLLMKGLVRRLPAAPDFVPEAIPLSSEQIARRTAAMIEARAARRIMVPA